MFHFHSVPDDVHVAVGRKEDDRKKSKGTSTLFVIITSSCSVKTTHFCIVKNNYFIVQIKREEKTVRTKKHKKV